MLKDKTRSKKGIEIKRFFIINCSSFSYNKYNVSETDGKVKA